MPPRKPPATLFDLALPITALIIRDHCDAILRNYGNVSQPAFKDRIEYFNEQLRKEVPVHVLDRIRLHHNLELFIYFKVKTLRVREATLRDTPIHQHFTYNVCPRLDRVTHLELSLVEGSLDLFRAVSATCTELESITIDGDQMGTGDECAIWLLYLTRCKKLKVIRNVCFDNDFDFISLDLQKHVTIRLLQELPELREFKCDIIEILDMEDMNSTAIYKLRKIDFNPKNEWISAENIKWLNIHCPFLNQFEFNIVPNDTILQALSLTDWGMTSLEFFGFKLTGPMTTLFTNKGMLLKTLTLYHREDILSYENLVWISQCCPVLKRLALVGDWCKGEDLTPSGTRSRGLFPNLEFFSIMSVYDRPTPVTTVLLESLVYLRELEYGVSPHTALTFLNIVSCLKNSFTYLREVTIYLFHEPPVLTSTFVLQFVPIAMRWKNIRKIQIVLVGDDLLPEATQYLKEITSTIKEQNLNLILEVG